MFEIMDLCNPKIIKEVMSAAKITFRHDLGQNFLIKREIPERIADECCDSEDTVILEIGPGIGCLTKELCERYPKVIAVEIDKGLIPVLGVTLADYANVTVVNSDIMKIDIKELLEREAEGKEVAVCANLPYYITTPILMHLLECGVKFSSITVMVQNEVAERLTAPAGDSEYGAITAAIAYYGEARRLFGVPAGCFMPAPKVNSAVVRIDLYKTPKYQPKSEKLMFGLIRAAFDMRRKTLPNAINAKYPEFSKPLIGECLQGLGYPENIRGERLDISAFSSLSDMLYEYKSST
ncbi:MAG: 16S rRNA (adenine(1518)-N(6)/adenine(1519)-N(6))-dimethyltransferase RsmA [Clostridia bacterium]|nr:16S rRNA (adenine(1518)-N(6)/adenine(1519)-N(6))-dimethyltransferase RsmA [Clostridia bacterium]